MEKRIISVIYGHKEMNDAERSIVHYISTPDIDRGGDIVNPFGMNDAEFAKSPTVFYRHNYGMPIAKSLWRTVSDKGVLAKTQFSSNDFAKDIYQLHKEDIIRTWSIGFEIDNKYEKAIEEKDDIAYINNWILLEYSSAPLAMNPNCLDQAKAIVKSFELIDEIDAMKEQAELIERINNNDKEIKRLHDMITEAREEEYKVMDELLKEIKSVSERIKIKSVGTAGKSKLSQKEIDRMIAGVVSEITGKI